MKAPVVGLNAYNVADGPFLEVEDGVNAKVIAATPSASNAKRNFFMILILD